MLVVVFCGVVCVGCCCVCLLCFVVVCVVVVQTWPSKLVNVLCQWLGSAPLPPLTPPLEQTPMQFTRRGGDFDLGACGGRGGVGGGGGGDVADIARVVTQRPRKAWMKRVQTHTMTK